MFYNFLTVYHSIIITIINYYYYHYYYTFDERWISSLVNRA